MVHDGRCRQLAARQQRIHRILRRHKSACDGCRARAAIGLQHVAINVDRALTELFQVEHRPQRTANQALDLLRAAALLAARGFAVISGVGGAGQHAIFGGDPALTGAFFVTWHFFLNRRRAQHFGGAKLNQHRALGIGRVVAGDGDRAKGVRSARAVSLK